MPAPHRRRCARRSRYLTAALPTSVFVFLGPAMAWAAEDMTLELVRHGQSEANESGILSTAPPGPDLTDTGHDQAQSVGDSIYDEHGGDFFDGIFASELVRTQETAAPLAQLLGIDVQDLAGLNEINAGIAEDAPEIIPGGIVYLVPALSWVLGSQLASIPGSPDVNGVAFDDRFDDAVQAMYDAGDTNGDGDINDVAFSSELAMVVWTLMNVENPDFDVIVDEVIDTHELLSNTGRVEITGNPDDGWTLVSWDGHDVAQDPGLGTDLFVDFRDLLTAPQTAAYHLWDAFLDGDPSQIWEALETGVGDVWEATAQFPDAVLTDVFSA
jgi:broad specificity phosphatase PhoE